MTKRLRVLGLVTVVAVMMLGAVSAAHAAGSAVFSAAKPAVGSASLTRPSWIAVTADDSLPIISATMTVNGIPAAVCIDRPVGHFVYDEEQESDVWVADDLTVARLMSYSPGSRVVPGVNTVVANVVSAGGVSTHSWTFNFGTVTTVSPISPVADADLTASPGVISAGVTSPSTSFTATMTVDGASVPLTYAAGTKTYTFTPQMALSPGLHAVVFSVRDASGALASKSWSFKVSPPMSSGWDCTSCHAAYPAAHPLSGCADCHDHAYTVAGGSHGDQVPTVAGCVGSGGQQSGACHRIDHTSDTAYGVWGSGPFACADCHAETNPAVPRHTDAETTAAHVSPSTGCARCHSDSLVTEHAKYPAASSAKFQCTVCHGASAAATVKEAVATGNTSCDACHGLSAGHEVLHVVARDDSCNACHAGASLTAVHPFDCAGCHESTDPKVLLAITGSDKRCASCHPVEHAAAASSHTSTQTDCSGAGCHAIADLASLHASATVTVESGTKTGCRVCHQSPTKQPTTSDCKVCHSQYHAQAEAKHLSPTTSGCFGAGCHDASKSLPTVHAIYAGPGTVNPGYASSCALCHANPSVNIATAGARCTTACHSGTTHSGLNAGHTPTSASADCTTCHDSGITGIHGADSDLTKCATCHANPANGTKTADCTGCHAPHPDVDHTVSGSCIIAGCHVSDAKTIHANGPKCAACHAPGVTPTFTCRACHSTPHPEANHGSADVCGSCHSTGNLMSVHNDNCATCHPTPASGMTYVTCSQTGCHVGVHADVAGHNSGHGDGDDCWSCHPGDGGGCDSCHTPSYERAAPVTTSDVRASYTTLALIRLFPVDQGEWGWASGIRSTHYRVDGSAVQTGTTILVNGPASGTQTHTVEFWSTDLAHNTETHHVAYFRVTAGPPDAIPPTGTMSVNSGATYANSVAVTVNSAVTDGETGIAGMRVDPGTGVFGSWTDYVPAYPITLAATNGTKTVRAEYKDAGGNILARTDSIILDNTLPAGTMTINGNAAYTNVAGVTVNSSVTDALSGLADMQWYSSGVWSAWMPYSGSIPVTLAAGSGSRAVYVYYRDNAGNVRSISDTIVYDPIAPTGSMSVNNNSVFATSTAATLNSVVTDSGGSFLTQMRIDPGSGTFGSWITYTASSGFTLASGDGLKTVRSEYRDGAGNVVSKTDTITLDTAAPSGTMVIANDAPSTAVLSVNVNSSMTDAVSGMKQMRVDPGTGTYGAWVTYAPTYAITLPSGDGVKTVNVQYNDNAGLVSTKTDTITVSSVVDTTPPTGSVVVSGGAAYVNTATVSLTLSATDVGGSGVSQMRFSNDGSSWGAWEGYATTKNWTLDPGVGSKTVYVQYRDVSLNASGSFTDTIGFDDVVPVTTSTAVNGTTYTGSQSFTLSPTDAGGSGVAGSWWQLDGTTGTWTNGVTVAVPAPATGTASHTLYWYSRDNATNKETTRSVTFDVVAGTASIETTSFVVTDWAWVDASQGASGEWGTYSIYADGVLIGTKPADGTTTWNCPQTNVSSGARIDIVRDCGFSTYGYLWDYNVPITNSLTLPAGSTRLEAATWSGFASTSTGDDWYDGYDDMYTYVVIPDSTLTNIVYSKNPQ